MAGGIMTEMAAEVTLIAIGLVSSIAFLFVYGGGQSRWWKTNVGLSMMGRAAGYSLIMGYAIAASLRLIPGRQWESLLLWGLVAALETAITVVFARERVLVGRARRQGYRPASEREKREIEHS